jgi:hypothetical protein
MSKEIKRSLLIAATISFLSILVITMVPGDRALEKGIYRGLAISILEDGDFNIFNQVPTPMKWVVTKNYNHPTEVSKGVVSFWLPFLAFEKSFIQFFTKPNYERALNVTSTFYLILSLILTWRFVNLLHQSYFKWNLFAVLILVSGSPLLYFAFVQNQNTDIVNFFWTAILFFFFWEIKDSTNLFNWFLLGICFMFGFQLKPNAIFYSPLLIMPVHTLWKAKELKKLFHISIAFVVGLGVIFAFSLLINFIQFGTLEFNYYRQLALPFEGAKITDLLLAPNGYLHISPIFAFSGVGMILVFTLKKFEYRRLISFLFILILTLKIFIISNKLIADEVFGARLFISELPILTYFVIIFLRQPIFKSTLFDNVFKYSITSGCVVWTLITFLWRIRHVNWGTHYTESLQSLLEPCFYLKKNLLLTFENITSHLAEIAPYFFIIFIILYIFEHLRKKKVFYQVTILFLSSIYIFSAILDAINNQNNVEKLKEKQAFSTSVVSTNWYAFAYDPVMSELKNYYIKAEAINDKERIKVLSKFRLQFAKGFADSITHDPIGYREDLKKGIIRPSYWDIPE